MSLIKKTKKYEKGHFKTLKEAAEILRCSPDAIRKGSIPIKTIPMNDSERPPLNVRTVDLDRYIEERERRAGIED